MKVLPWHYKSPLAGPNRSSHQEGFNLGKENTSMIEIYWNIEYVHSSRPFSSSTYTRSCRNKSWIANVPYESLWYLSYILNSIQGSSNIMNIQHFNIHNLDIISEYITPPPGPKVGRCLSCTRWIAIHKLQDVASKYLYISMEKRNV